MHEINETDNVLLHTDRAWHGLGTIVTEDLTPQEALVRCGLDWTVEPETIFREMDGQQVAIDSHRLMVRSDNRAQLGMVGPQYEPVQNSELADLADVLKKTDSRVTVETCGSIRDGKKVWFLCRSESFNIGNFDDEVIPYLLLSNGHDGLTALRVTPTTVRVVCSNTLHAVIPDEAKGECRTSVPSLAFSHTANMKQRVEQAKSSLLMMHESVSETRELADYMSTQDVRTKELVGYFCACYERDFGAIPIAAETPAEHRAKLKAHAAFDSMTERFDNDINLSGANWWTAFNAYSGWMQHDQRNCTTENQVENQMYSNLLGSNASRTQAAFEAACQLAS